MAAVLLATLGVGAYLTRRRNEFVILPPRKNPIDEAKDDEKEDKNVSRVNPRMPNLEKALDAEVDRQKEERKAFEGVMPEVAALRFSAPGI